MAAQADVVANHIRLHLSELKNLSQYAIAVDTHVAPMPPPGSTASTAPDPTFTLPSPTSVADAVRLTGARS